MADLPDLLAAIINHLGVVERTIRDEPKTLCLAHLRNAQALLRDAYSAVQPVAADPEEATR